MTKKEKNEMLLEGCKEGDFDKVRLALNFGANVRAKDKDKMTPLHYASFFDSIKIVELLIKMGADVRAKDVYGNTPLHSVLGKNGSYQHCRALSNGRMKIIKLLLKAGAGVRAKDKWGKTPLYLAEPHEIQDLFKKYIKKHLQI